MELLLNILSLLPNFFFMSAILAIVVIIIGLGVVLVACFVIKFWFKFVHKKTFTSDNGDGEVKVGFFHPYCDAGGGGERVLWTGVRALRRRFPAAQLIIYTGDVEVLSFSAWLRMIRF